MDSLMRVAVANWELRPIRGDGDFFAHLFDFVDAAHGEAADLLVLPELFVLELLQLEPDIKDEDVAKYLVQFDEVLEAWFERISASSEMMIVGGSHFKRLGNKIVNACPIAHSSWGVKLATKNKLTQYEKVAWNLAAGEGLTVIPDSRVGVTVCYDSEFPEAGRALAESGVLLHCVPAFTETEHGFHRVRHSCQARAIENQVFVAHASLVGSIGREPVQSAYGCSAIIGPSVEPFAANGILAETVLNQEGIAFATLDFDKLLEARQTGDVRNWQDRDASNWKLNRVDMP